MPIYQFTARQRLFGNAVRNVFYYSIQDESVSGLQAVVDGIRGAWYTHLSAELSNDWTLNQCDVRKVDAAGWPTVTYAFTAGSLTGGDSLENLANQLALLVHCTGYTTKPNRTRSYLGGFTEGDMVDGLWASAVLNAATAWGNAMVDPTGGAVAGVGRLSVEWDGQNTYVLGGNLVSTVTVNNNPATQRRRRRYVGI